MGFFITFNFVTLCQFYSLNSPVLYTKLHYKTTEGEKRNFFAYMAASSYRVMSKQVENGIFRHK